MKKVVAIVGFSFFSVIGMAQNVGIGTTNPNASAQLDVSSTSAGFLPPRMTVAQRTAITSPAAGLVIYCTDCDELQVYNGVIWKNGAGNAACQVAPAVGLPSVKICNQVWMVKNLDVSKYRNGDDILQVTNATDWANVTIGAWCYYANNTANGTVYGKLYNWYALNDSRGLAPAGWHIPSDAEWTILTDCLGSASAAGGPMKEIGTTYWLNPNTGANNSSGFSGLPGGYRNFSGAFTNIGSNGYWWSATESSTPYAWLRTLYSGSSGVSRYDDGKQNGFSVRCLRN